MERRWVYMKKGLVTGVTAGRGEYSKFHNGARYTSVHIFSRLAPGLGFFANWAYREEFPLYNFGAKFAGALFR